MIEGLIFWAMFAVVVAVIASSRNRSGFGWFLLALVISPLLALILVLAMPRPEPTIGVGRCDGCRQPLAPGETKCPYCGTTQSAADVVQTTDKTCPKCAETVKAAAVICRFCGHDFEHPDGPPKTLPVYRESV